VALISRAFQHGLQLIHHARFHRPARPRLPTMLPAVTCLTLHRKHHDGGSTSMAEIRRWLRLTGNSSDSLAVLCQPDLRYLQVLTCGASSSMAALLP
jgi:hypothetical protein